MGVLEEVLQGLLADPSLRTQITEAVDRSLAQLLDEPKARFGGWGGVGVELGVAPPMIGARPRQTRSLSPWVVFQFHPQLVLTLDPSGNHRGIPLT